MIEQKDLREERAKNIMNQSVEPEYEEAKELMGPNSREERIASVNRKNEANEDNILAETQVPI